MARQRFAPRTPTECEEVAFVDAEAAWFWFMRCQKARWDGARFESGMALQARPCEPDDIYRAARQLMRERKIGSHHFSVLCRFGVLDRPPDPRCREEAWPCRLWDEALDKLTTVLRHKGIVE